MNMSKLPRRRRRKSPPDMAEVLSLAVIGILGVVFVQAGWQALPDITGFAVLFAGIVMLVIGVWLFLAKP